MPMEGAFTKAKKKGKGGFGASKASRFGGPKESWESGPNPSSYDLSGFNATASKSKSKKADGAGAGFGSREPRGAKVSGQSNDAPGPGAYDTDVAQKEKKAAKAKASSATFKSGSKKGLELNPAYGKLDFMPEGCGTLKTKNKGDKMFGGADRFEKPKEVLPVDYDLPSAFDDALAKPTPAQDGKGMGGIEPRGAAILGQSNDAPPVGTYEVPNGFEPSAYPSAAFASKSQQIPLLEPTVSPGPNAYDVPADNINFNGKSFNAATDAGFGSKEPIGAAVLGQSNDAPGPGAYEHVTNADVGTTKQEQATRSYMFASGTTKGLELNPAYGKLDFMPDGVGALKTKNKGDKMFGGADRFDKPREVLAVDYDLPSAFDDALAKPTPAQDGKGMGGIEPRDAPVSGQANDAPGPGAYMYSSRHSASFR